MQTWSFTFKGYYPVGAGGIVNAYTLAEAKDRAEAYLESIGLKQTLPNEAFKSIDVTLPGVYVIVDGNY